MFKNAVLGFLRSKYKFVLRSFNTVYIYFVFYSIVSVLKSTFEISKRSFKNETDYPESRCAPVCYSLLPSVPMKLQDLRYLKKSFKHLFWAFQN